MTQEFKYLFSPLKIGSFTVRNRILSTAHATGYGENSLPSDQHLNYWVSKAKGGIGLICTEVHSVHPSAHPSPSVIALYDDRIIPPFKKIADAVHDHGAKIVGQLWHPGRQSSSKRYGRPLWGASDISSPLYAEKPHQMTVEEIQELVRCYGEAAARLKEADLDGVEIHAAHGYLPCQFMSPLTNNRNDEYGGSEENRLRFLFEVIDSVRAAVGGDYTVGIRINGDEFADGGLTLEDMKRISPRLEATGKIDFLNVSFSGGPVIAPMYFPSGGFVYLAAGIKEVVDIPVFCIGRINDPVHAESILEDNQADMVGMTRANLCDPELPNKAKEGKLDDIRKCIACNEACWGRITDYLPITCAINPAAGREEEMAITPAKVKKKVMIIGAGAAGLETARVAALRGHKVHLYETQDELGGQLNIAAKAPGREDFAEVPRYYNFQMENLGVEVHLGTSVTPELVKELDPDVVVVATGSTGAVPDIPGADGDNVVDVRDVLLGNVEVGDNVVIIDQEHHIQAISTAELLADKGKKVEILNPLFQIGSQVEMITQMFAYTRALGKGIIFSPMTNVRSISGNTVVAFNTFTQIEREIENVDTVVLAFGGKAEDSLYHQLKDQVKELYLVGHAASPRKLLDSVFDGLRTAREI